MLHVEHIDVNYGKSRVINDISFDIVNGEKVVFLGRNGVGKTTLLKSLVGLLHPTRGTILFMGQNVTLKRPSEHSKLGMAYVPQGREIIPDFTVRENLELGAMSFVKNPSQRIEQILEYFPILKDHLSRKGGVLSGGQQQQLAISRALMPNPKMILLDEPTEGIQPNVVHEISIILNRISSEMGISILMVEQNLRFARKVAQRFFIIQKGTIVSMGAMDQLDQSLVDQYLTV